MTYKYMVPLLVFLVFSACQSAKETRYLKKFVEEFAMVEEQYQEKITSTTALDQRAEFKKEKVAHLEKLLNKYGKLVSSDEAELLESKLLIEISRFKEAEEKIDRLLSKQSNLSEAAKLAKVQILVYRGHTEEALSTFKSIEDEITPGLELSSVYLYLTLYSPDHRVVEEYGRKFLNSPMIPKKLMHFKTDVYSRLSYAASERGDLTGALDMQNKAISITEDPGEKALLETRLMQLQLIGKPALPISAQTWLNGNPLAADALKGKVVIFGFWATWCDSCRQLIPSLVKLYNKYKDKGLVVIGLTRLYGTYNDGNDKKGVVVKGEEMDLLKAFIRRSSITYPAAITSEGDNWELYKIMDLPTLIYIGKHGNVRYIQVGAAKEEYIKDKIKTLMEEK